LVHIQAASPSNARDEFISIYNTTSEEIDITGWCLTNKANVAFVCFQPPEPKLSYILPDHSFATAASDSFLTSNMVTAHSVTSTFTSSNQSSGSIVNSGDTISLVNAHGEHVDRYQWTAAIPTGKVALRTSSGTDANNSLLYDGTAGWSYEPLSQLPPHQVERRDTPIPEEEEPPIEEPPAGAIVHPIITELLPNPIGSDTGTEFIELYNPSDSTSIHLSLYRLRVGKSLEKEYQFPSSIVLSPHEYRAFYNNEIAYNLLNTSSQVQLSYNGSLLGDPVLYTDPKDGTAWALFDTSWSYTTQPTPHAANRSSTPLIDIEESVIQTTLKPCADNQYRSPETNRCRLIATTQTAPPPCKEGYYRHPETNRCRKEEEPSVQSACKEGQERNPETNRCRTVVKMTAANYDVKGVATSQQGLQWYWWLGIIGIVGSIVFYALWEWRQELRSLLRKSLSLFARNKS
jgi:hypothetical protein